MPITELDPTTALVVIDLQTGTLSNPMVHPIADVIGNTVQLLAGFRSRELPVVLATADGSPAGRNDYGPGGAREWPAAATALIPELEQSATDATVTRRAWDAFSGSDLHEQLQSRGVTQVVLAGVATSFGVESTARRAYDLGYHVVVVTDAVTDLRAESHENSVTRVFPALGQTGTTAELLEALQG
jgi:nicotinamidase-related amidase